MHRRKLRRWPGINSDKRVKPRLTYHLLLAAMLLLSTAAAAQVTDTVYNKRRVSAENAAVRKRIYNPPLVIKTSPTALLSGGVVPFTAEYRLLMEKTTGKRQSEQFGISYLGKSLLVKTVENTFNIPPDEIYKINGWRVQYEHKFYWIGRRKYAPYGFYVAPMISYSDAHIAVGLPHYYRHAYFDFRHFNIDGVIGVQAGKINRLTIDFYAGFGYKNNKVYYHPNMYTYLPYDTSDFGDVYNMHFNAVAGINLGYSL